MVALINIQEEALKIKLDLVCHLMLYQTVAAGGWWLQDMAAGG